MSVFTCRLRKQHHPAEGSLIEFIRIIDLDQSTSLQVASKMLRLRMEKSRSKLNLRVSFHSLMTILSKIT